MTRTYTNVKCKDRMGVLMHRGNSLHFEPDIGGGYRQSYQLSRLQDVRLTTGKDWRYEKLVRVVFANSNADADTTKTDDKKQKKDTVTVTFQFSCKIQQKELGKTLRRIRNENKGTLGSKIRKLHEAITVWMAKKEHGGNGKQPLRSSGSRLGSRNESRRNFR